jgi:hypothetical protein
MNEGRKILQEVVLPYNSGKLVLYDWISYEGFRSPQNLELHESSGNIIWAAKPPDDSADCFVRVRLDGDTIVANSFSAWMVTLDKQTGKILTKVFTK